MADKLAVYICTGYGIADALEIEALKTVAADEFKAELVKECLFHSLRIQLSPIGLFEAEVDIETVGETGTVNHGNVQIILYISRQD
jgi:hypothetical protein